MKTNKGQKSMKAFGVRADEEKMKLAHAAGINTGDIFRKALDQALMRESGFCPTCSQKVKNGKHK